MMLLSSHPENTEHHLPLSNIYKLGRDLMHATATFSHKL